MIKYVVEIIYASKGISIKVFKMFTLKRGPAGCFHKTMINRQVKSTG